MPRVNRNLREPDFAGDYGRAWIADHDDLGSALGAWLVEAPHAHLAWTYHAVLLGHLREQPGLKSPVITTPGATHELNVLALNPDYDENLDPSDMSTFKWLLGPDVVEQFTARDDAQALAVAETTVVRCVEGKLVPDSDFRTLWSKFVHYALQQ